MLRKEKSVGDWGTFASNAIFTGNSNALGDVLGENYYKIREFLQTETDAFICSATMTYFGMDDVSDQPKAHCFPEGLKDASLPEKRQWFHEQVYSMLGTFVMDCVITVKMKKRLSNVVTLHATAHSSTESVVLVMSRPHTVSLLKQKQGKTNRRPKNPRTAYFNMDVSILALVFLFGMLRMLSRRGMETDSQEYGNSLPSCSV